MARLKGPSNSLTILSVYATIREAPDHLKDKLYANLQLTLNKIPRKDILVIGVTSLPGLMRNYPFHKTNKNNICAGIDELPAELLKAFQKRQSMSSTT
ncbi:hypothetical protein QYM36_013589 [Artemia franciscana]|uniref:Uncharacterized protein n=1 Tax=Artemia franciscana TaxID=6661 RepID=A0AA88L284_ARTSF|nr:hypothetical protein QYM36_013589 [Artemia franciscana]